MVAYELAILPGFGIRNGRTCLAPARPVSRELAQLSLKARHEGPVSPHVAKRGDCRCLPINISRSGTKPTCRDTSRVRLFAAYGWPLDRPTISATAARLTRISTCNRARSRAGTSEVVHNLIVTRGLGSPRRLAEGEGSQLLDTTRADS
jgi:hypothetical protein